MVARIVGLPTSSTAIAAVSGETPCSLKWRWIFSTTTMASSTRIPIEKIKEIEGIEPQIITTSAKIFPNTVSYAELSVEMFNDERPYLILFGTGWGLTQEVMDLSYKILEPIRGKTKYNHLSVRSAVSIILDRLIGEK